MDVNKLALIEAAKQAKERSYSPYSKFRVGSALSAGDKVYLGANIENVSYSLTTCAERVAIYQAHMAKADMSLVTQIAIASDSEEVISPCGACRQVMVEMLPGEAEVIMLSEREVQVMKVRDLLPGAFSQAALSNRSG